MTVNQQYIRIHPDAVFSQQVPQTMGVPEKLVGALLKSLTFPLFAAVILAWVFIQMLNTPAAPITNMEGIAIFVICYALVFLLMKLYAKLQKQKHIRRQE